MCSSIMPGRSIAGGQNLRFAASQTANHAGSGCRRAVANILLALCDSVVSRLSHDVEKTYSMESLHLSGTEMHKVQVHSPLGVRLD